MAQIKFDDGYEAQIDDRVGVLLQHLMNLSDKADRHEVERFIARFKENYVSCDLVRVGGDGDGGYLMPNILQDVSYCFSPGVDYMADFEKELSEKYNIKAFMADASVDGPPFHDDNFNFVAKYLGAYTSGNITTLSDWMRESVGEDKSQKILQMDIEGAEYDVLIIEDAATLASFSIIIIEFHFLQKIFERDFLRMISAVFEKMFANFSICHAHPNNNCGVEEIDGISVPIVLELTFIRNDLLPRFQNSSEIALPHELDRKNVPGKEDLVLPDIWWKS